MKYFVNEKSAEMLREVGLQRDDFVAEMELVVAVRSRVEAHAQNFVRECDPSGWSRHVTSAPFVATFF